jgi:hypothetical protein
MEIPTEEPQEVAVIQQWTTQKAQLFWFLDPMEFLIAVIAMLFFPFIAWQCGMNLIATLAPGLCYLTLLVLTKLGRRRGYLDQLIRYYLRSKIWYPGAYEDPPIHSAINPNLEFQSIEHLFDPGFSFHRTPDLEIPTRQDRPLEPTAHPTAPSGSLQLAAPHTANLEPVAA